MTTDKREFPAFPYKPYSIQIDFMNALYQFLEKGGVSMLESPTGTRISCFPPLLDQYTSIIHLGLVWFDLSSQGLEKL